MMMIDKIYDGLNKETINYNWSKLASGVYFMKLKIENGKTYTQKFIVL
jgi:hypothetical protein